MDFPMDTRVEFELGGTWTNVTKHVLLRDPIRITRGRSAEASSADPAKCTFTLNNRDGRYSPRNPMSPYYGVLGRNTRVRVSVPDERGAALAIRTGSETSRAVCSPHAALQITGDLDVRAEVEADRWGSWGEILTQLDSANHLCWTFYMRPDHRLTLAWTPDGTAEATRFVSPPDPLPIRSGRLAIRATLDVDNGAGAAFVTFWTAPTLAGPWTAIGTPVHAGTATTINAGTGTLNVGAHWWFTANAFAGRYYGAEVRNGIAGTVVASPLFSSLSAGIRTFTDSAGRTWVIGVDAEITDRRYRFHGEIAQWPQQWDVSGEDRFVQVQASGVRRRLTMNAPPLRSTMYREHATRPLKAYWPLEDGSIATQAASGLGGPAAEVSAGVQMGAYTGWTSSGPLPTMGTGTISGIVPPFPPVGEVSVRAFVFVAEAVAAETSLISVDMSSTGVTRWDLRLQPSGGLRLVATTSEGAAEVDHTALFAMNSRGFTLVTLELRKAGANVDWKLIVTDFVNTMRITDEIPAVSTSGTLTNRLVGVPSRVVIGRQRGLGQTVVGHLAVADDVEAFANTTAAIAAWNGESPVSRVARLCGEEGVPVRFDTMAWGVPQSGLMGDQKDGTLVDLLDEAATTDVGILYEPRDGDGFAYRSRASLFAQTPRVVLDYSVGEIAGDLHPVDDDQHIKNRLTVRRIDGSSLIVEQTSGPVSVLDPPDGVGPYPDEQDVSLEADSMLREHAGFLLRLGTVDEARYPRLMVRLHSPRISSAMAAALLDTDIGDRLDITGLAGTGLPPDDVGQLVDGYTETLRLVEYSIEFNLSPASPWSAAELDANDPPRAGAEGSTIAGPAANAPAFAGVVPAYANATSVTVSVPPGATTVLAGIVWNTLDDVTVPAGWTVLRALEHNSSRAIIVTAPASAGAGVFTSAATAKLSVVSLGYSGSVVSASAALLDDTGDAIHAAPALEVTDVPVRVVRFYWDKTTTTTSFVANDPGATTRGVQYGTGSGSCALLATDQVVTTPGMVPSATATANVAANQGGGFTVALLSDDVPAPGSGLSPTATAMAVTVGGRPWTTDPADMPFDVMVGGERMTVTSVAGSSTPQTMTVVRSVNGIVKSHAVGAAVDLFKPAYPAY